MPPNFNLAASSALLGAGKVVTICRFLDKKKKVQSRAKEALQLRPLTHFKNLQYYDQSPLNGVNQIFHELG